MMKTKIISIIIIIAVVLAVLGASVYAKTTLSDKEILSLEAFGLLEEDLSDRQITRAEFVKLAVRLINKEQMAFTLGTRELFSDVKTDHDVNVYVGLLCDMGVLSGDGKGMFYPDNGILYDEAKKILVSVLGYGIMADKYGGYPFGYTKVANSLSITDGIFANDSLSYTDTMKMLYNCLDVKFMEPIIGEDKYEKSASSPRSVLMGNQSTGMVKLRGVVQANYDSYLNEGIKDIKSNEIAFFNMIVDKGNTDADLYLGQEVDAYLVTNDGVKYSLASVRPTNNNKIFTLKFEDIDNFQPNIISYFDGNKKVKYDIDNAVIIFNGRPATYTEATTNMENGSATFISNDEDDKIDVIFINSYVSGIVDVIDCDGEYIKLKGSKKVNGSEVLRFDSEDENLHFYFTDEAGSLISPQEIESGELVSVFSDLNGNLVKVVKGTKIIEGKIETIEFDEKIIVTINQKSYIGEKDVLSSAKVGETVTAMLSFEGKIADIKISTKELYGAIIATEKGRIGHGAKVKMVLPGNIADKKEKAEDPDAEEIVSLVARNSDVQIFILSDYVKYCGEKISDDEAESKISTLLAASGYFVIEYALNSKNEISMINVPEEIGNAYSKKYNSKERTFGGTAGGAFGVNDETIAICIPSNEITSELDYMAQIKMNNAQSYYVSSYDLNEKTHCADLIVINDVMLYETTGNINTSSDIGLVEKSFYKTNMEGDFVQTVSMITKEGRKDMEISEYTSSGFDFKSIKSGDFMYYSIDSFGRIDGGKKLVSSFPLPEDTISRGNYDVYVGYVDNVEYNWVSETLNCWIDIVSFKTNDGRERTFEVRRGQSAAPPVYIYDANKKTAELGKNYDIMRNHKKVVICTVGSTVKAIMIIV